ncbi:hypothetical protein VNI00_000888 [Paramarasmius palmivorus]|uniref:Carboxypeptidase n=1 Tax=Paramarasmius palmivorus TaxID=297713 RepID=A0AAW0E869_9AGAR
MKKASLLAFSLPLVALSSPTTQQAVLENFGNVDTAQVGPNNGLEYELVTHSSFDEHQLRIARPNLCDPTVKQYSGYLDISETKHLFFWFFESRKAPEEAPLILWLNGGPGGSSALGLLMELGPCWVSDGGKNTTFNHHSWNTDANIIFIDQPVEVGFSYDDNGPTVNSSAVGAQDIYAFFQLFFDRFPEYSTQPFHVAGESYAGVYVPNIVNAIYQHNKEVKDGLKHINLASVILANAFTNPGIQYASIVEYVCGGSPYPVPDPDGFLCESMRVPTDICVHLVEECQKAPSRYTCEPAVIYCNARLMEPLAFIGINPYDIRMRCSPESGTIPCYEEESWIKEYLNTPSNKIALGVDPARNWTQVSLRLNHDFTATGEMAFNHALLLPELVNDGIRLLVYVGDTDTICTNFIGQERYVEALDTKFHDEFSEAKLLPWRVPATGRLAGEVRSAGAAGNVTYVRIYDAGHLAPYDQPEALHSSTILAVNCYFSTRIINNLQRSAGERIAHLPKGPAVIATTRRKLRNPRTAAMMKHAWTALLAFTLPLAVFSSPTIQQSVLGNLGHGLEIAAGWIPGNEKQHVYQNGLQYELVTHPSFNEHQLRITQPDLCDSSVKQYSGFLDISENKHLFFWFFESRNAPEDAPLILWLNGGPGGSSVLGLLMELGPCQIIDEGKNTTFNPHSWNTDANIIFIDQPVEVGFSYDDRGPSVNTSTVAAQDIYAFFQLFFERFPEYSTQPFHVAGESYGGIYVPNIANVIYQHNKEQVDNRLKHINLASVILANAFTHPKIQYASIVDYACGGAPYPVADPNGFVCESLRVPTDICLRLVETCQNNPSRYTCEPAVLYCNIQLMEPVSSTSFTLPERVVVRAQLFLTLDLGLNPYDIRKTCQYNDRSTICYEEADWVERWMNTPTNKAALGVPPERNYTAINMRVYHDFMAIGEMAFDHASLLTDLVNDGVRLLVYVGDTDAICTNFIGQHRYVEALNTKFHDEFAQAKLLPWHDSVTGRLVGQVRSAGSAGNVTFVRVYDAGHMVPYDQPEASNDLITRWIKAIPLST